MLRVVWAAWLLWVKNFSIRSGLVWSGLNSPRPRSRTGPIPPLPPPLPPFFFPTSMPASAAAPAEGVLSFFLPAPLPPLPLARPPPLRTAPPRRTTPHHRRCGPSALGSTSRPAAPAPSLRPPAPWKGRSHHAMPLAPADAAAAIVICKGGGCQCGGKRLTEGWRRQAPTDPNRPPTHKRQTYPVGARARAAAAPTARAVAPLSTAPAQRDPRLAALHLALVLTTTTMVMMMAKRPPLPPCCSRRRLVFCFRAPCLLGR